MNKLKLEVIVRNSTILKGYSKQGSIIERWYNTKKDDEEPVKTQLGEADSKNEKSKIVQNKLNRLLKELIEMPTTEASSLKLAQPLSKRMNKAPVKASDKLLEEKLHKEKKTIENVVKEVAESLGGNTKKTESELMKKFLNSNKVTDNGSSSVPSLSDVFKNMKIDRSQPPIEQQSRSQQVKQILNQSRRQQQQPKYPEPKSSKGQRIRRPQINKMENIDLFGSEPLGIFTADPEDYTEGVKNETWDYLKQREMKLAVTHPPNNYFQQMILWTEQGKLWKFPIDNEQGLEEEQNVSFADHIFLEKHLQSWCPSKGPIRHFMELVCVGLSKNPYLTVTAKKEHIEWYRNYFEDKGQLLREVGVDFGEVKRIETK